MFRKSHDPVQLSLGLPEQQPSESALRRAFHDHVALGMTYEQAMAKPAIAICLKNIALGYERRAKSTPRKEPT